MHAIRQYEFGPPSTLSYEKLLDPTPGPGHVRVAVEAALLARLAEEAEPALRGPEQAVWLNRLESVQGWVNPWTTNVTADSAVAGAYAFDTSVDLTQDALTQRGAAGEAASG